MIDAALRVAHNELRHQSRLEKVFSARNLVVGSESKLGQVLVNLITNALQALPPERSSDQNLIRITTTDEGDDVVIDVEDNGIGMTADVMRRVFDPFFTTHPVGSATGLGLTAAHNVVKGMGGRLTVESEQGRGSHFRVVLPVAAGVGQQEGADTRSTDRVAPPGGLVLVVDDEPMIAGVIEAKLVNN